MATSFTSLVKFFPELETFILDQTVERIHINPNETVFIRRTGAEHDEEVGEHMFSQERLRADLGEIAELLTGRRIDRRNPLLEFDFEDGSYIAALVAPASPLGVTITLSRIPLTEGEKAVRGASV